jgi:hypothetical protein
MRRPKIRDMNPDQLVRFRLMQTRRHARRSLQRLNSIPPEELTAEEQKHLEVLMRWCRSVIAITKPSWVQKAPLGDAVLTLKHLGRGIGIAGNSKRGMQ